MTLTLGQGPLAADAVTSVNYEIVGPQHKILFAPFPRRIRAMYGGETLVDTQRAMLLHESNILPAVYVPVEDVRFDVLHKTGHSTHCPFKGDASYWTITVGDRTSENAIWGYEDPVDGAPWLEGYVAMYWDRLDQWFDEDEEVFGHIRDPYHRVDVRPTSRAVRVSIDGRVVAETTAALVLSETGLPNRYYVPTADIRTDQFEQSATTTHCPYKGDSEYWTLTGDAPVGDTAWSYPAPFDEASRIGDHWSFDGDHVVIDLS